MSREYTSYIYNIYISICEYRGRKKKEKKERERERGREGGRGGGKRHRGKTCFVHIYIYIIYTMIRLVLMEIVWENPWVLHAFTSGFSWQFLSSNSMVLGWL